MSLGRFSLRAALVLMVMAAGLLASCTQSIPHIIETDTRLVNVLTQSTGRVEKRLELYVHLDAEDEDHGIANLIITAPDADHLSWEIDIDYLFTEISDGEVWIGTNAIIAPSSSKRPARFQNGTYTATVVSEAGYEDSISFDLVDAVRYSDRTASLFPTYDPATDMITSTNTQIKSVTFRGFDDALNPMGSVDVSIAQPLTGQAQEITRGVGRDVAFFEIEVYDSLLKQWFRNGYYRYE